MNRGTILFGFSVTAGLFVLLAASRVYQQEIVNEIPEANKKTVVLDIVLPVPEEPEIQESSEVKQVSEPLVSIATPQLQHPSIEAATILSKPTILSKQSFQPSIDGVQFQLDRAPSVIQPTQVVTKKTTPRPRTSPKVVTPRPVVKKSVYGIGELDGTPSELRSGRFTWPRTAKGNTGTVKFLLELSTSGKVRVVSVISASDPKLVSAAKKVAESSLYTAPKKNGIAVKSQFYKTYQLKKR